MTDAAPSTEADARDRAGFAWASKVMGGRLIKTVRQQRWRTQWFLDFDIGQSEPKRVVMRGFRNPGYTDEMDDAASRARLQQEAGVLNALQDAPVRVPQYYGHNEELGWTLMEFVDGETQIIDEPDADLRFKIYSGYVDELARLHAYPIEKLDLPASLARPRNCKEFAQNHRDHCTAFYRSRSLPRPDPVTELTLQWVSHNEVPDERPICLGLGDVGALQFLYGDNDYRCLIDLEYAYLCDPLMEMAMMRIRDAVYHTGRMPEHIRRYGAAYERLTGIALSMDALQYWTIAGMGLWNVFTVVGTQTNDPKMVDIVFAHSYNVKNRRCILEALAEKYGINLAPPSLPPPEPTMLGPLHELLINQFENYYATRMKDPTEQAFVKYSTGLAHTLARNNATQLRLENESRDELAEVLRHKPRSWDAGLAELEQLIITDHMRDLEKRLTFLHSVEVRCDYLYEPMQLATGVSRGRPLERFDQYVWPHT